MSVSPAAPAFPMPRSCPIGPPDGYATLREERPITRVTLPTGRTAWLVTNHAYAGALLADPRLSVHRADPGFPALTHGQTDLARQTVGWLTWQDPPEHTANRRMVVAEFTHRRVQAMRPRIQAIVDGCLDRMLAGPRPTDLVQALSLPVPSLVICELLGVPYESRDQFQRRTATAVSFSSSNEERVKALAEVREFLSDLVTAKLGQPEDDLLSRLIVKYREAGAYDHEHLTGLATQLLIGGHETTANMISLGTIALLDNPTQLAAVRADPDLVPGAVEEFLRFFSIADYVTGRVALEDIEIDGTRIRKGEGVLCPLAAANHDTAIFDKPERLDVHRDARRHLAFGYGPHQCLGQSLARAELQIVFSTLFRRLPHLRLTVLSSQLRYKDNATIFGVHSLPVTW